MRLSRIRVAIIGVTLAASGVFAAVAIKKRLSSHATPEQVVAIPLTSNGSVATATPAAAAETATRASSGSTPDGEPAMAAEAAASTRADRPLPYVLGTELVEYDRVVVTGQQHPAAKPFTKRTAVKETIAVVALARSEPALNPHNSAPAIAPVPPALIATLPESAADVERASTSGQAVESGATAAAVPVGQTKVARTSTVKKKPVGEKADKSSLDKTREAKVNKARAAKPAEKAATKPSKADPKNAAKAVNKAAPGKAATKTAVAKPNA